MRTTPGQPVIEPPFGHGVASFDPTDRSVILWTRAPGVGRLSWCVTRRGTDDPVAGGEVAVRPDDDHCVAVTVDGLDPATTYDYWFDAGPTRSPVGRTRTLAAAGTDPVRLAVVCCGDFSRGHFTAYRAVAEADVDLVVHVGDYIYETASKGDTRVALPDREVVSLDDYRTRYAQTRGDADLVALHQRHPMVTIWDDHDIADNAWRGGAKPHDPNVHGPWDRRLDAAVRAHHEWLPDRSPGDDPLAVYRSFTIGDLAELVVLDTRIVGRDQQADDHPSLPVDDPRRSLLGDDQRAWAHARVSDAARPWCLLVSQVVLNRMELPVATGAKLGELAPSGYAVIDGRAMCTDEWDGYPAERRALTEVMAARGPGVVTLSGDVHSAWAFEGPCLPAAASPNAPVDPGAGDTTCRTGDPVAVEFVAPCVTATPMARQLPPGWRKLLGVVADKLPEARWFELERHGFLVLEVAADEARAHFYAVDSEDPHARPELTAAWRHRHDAPGRLERIEDDTLAATLWPDDGPGHPAPPRPDSLRRSLRTGRRRTRAWAGAAVVAAGAGAAAALVRARGRGAP